MHYSGIVSWVGQVASMLYLNVCLWSTRILKKGICATILHLENILLLQMTHFLACFLFYLTIIYQPITCFSFYAFILPSTDIETSTTMLQVYSCHPT